VPRDMVYCGGMDEKRFVYTIGEEVNADGTWVTLVQHDASPSSPPARQIIVWPAKETPGIHRGVKLTSRIDIAVTPPITDLFGLAHLEGDDGVVKTYTIAYVVKDSGDLAINWTREFHKLTDENEDTVPIAIRASFTYIAVLAAVYSENATKVGYGINVYNAANGTLALKVPIILMPSGWDMPVDMFFVAGTDFANVMVTGYTIVPQTGKRVIMTAAYDAVTGNFLPGWDPTDTVNNPQLLISQPGDHCEPVRIIWNNDLRVAITGRAYETAGVDCDVLTVCYEQFPTNSTVRWFDRYDSGGIDVVADGTAANANPDQGGAISKFWVTGTRYTTGGLTQMQLIQYDNIGPFTTPPGALYPEGRRDWNGVAAHQPLQPTQGQNAEGHHVDVARTVYGAPHHIRPYISGRVQRSGGSNLWDFGVWRYNRFEPPPLQPKGFDWAAVDTNIGSGAGNVPVALDVRFILHDPNGPVRWPKLWFSAASEISSEVQMYNAQWRDVTP
jgi:hypothetical protein